MTTDREFIKEILRGKLNQRVYGISDIRRLFEDIGLKVSEVGIRNNLQESRIFPSAYNINPARFRYNNSIQFYPEEEVWKYLKKLEQEKKIDLEAAGVHNFEDILKRKNTMKDHYIKGRIIHKQILDD